MGCIPAQQTSASSISEEGTPFCTVFEEPNACVYGGLVLYIAKASLVCEISSNVYWYLQFVAKQYVGKMLHFSFRFRITGRHNLIDDVCKGHLCKICVANQPLTNYLLSNCLLMFFVTWKSLRKLLFPDSKLKHEYAQKGPQSCTHCVAWDSKCIFMVQFFTPVGILKCVLDEST